MFVEQLQQVCHEAIAAGDEAIVVVRSDDRVLLCGNRGPRGEVVCCSGRRRVVRYKAKSVLSFLDREERKAAELKASINEVLK